MPIKEIETKRIYQQIADQLIKLIDRGEFPVNSRLPSERELADKFKVSRPSVREALIALEVLGKVQIRMGSGVYVSESSPKKIKKASLNEELAPFELIQARHLVESEIAAQAALNRTNEDIKHLEKILEEMITSSKSNLNPLDKDREFHIALAAASGNHVLKNLTEQLFNARLGVLFSKLSNYFDTQETWNQAIKEHKALLKAVKSKDANAARLAMQHHMERAYTRFSASFTENEEPVTQKSSRSRKR